MVKYCLPSVGTKLKLDRHCPHCGDPNGNIHSAEHDRHISDPKAHAIVQRRMKCPACRTTWTIRSDGVGPGRQRSERLRGLGIILYMLGLSYRGVETFLPCLDCVGGKSSIERDMYSAGLNAEAYHKSAMRTMRVRILGVDGAGAAMAGKNEGLLFYVDVEKARLICVEPIQEKDALKVRQHVARVMAAVGAEELRTDEHPCYKGITSEDRHRLCLTHWRKSKCKRASDLRRRADEEGRQLESHSMQELLDLLRLDPRPPRAPPELGQLVSRYIRCRKGLLWKINQLLQHVERTWDHVSNDPADATNNATERVIGLRFKIRSKTMRGFKSEPKVLAHPYLSSFLQGEDGISDLQKII
jgi:hypothetical protein